MEQQLVDKQKVLGILEMSNIGSSQFEEIEKEIDNLEIINVNGNLTEIIKNARLKLSDLIYDLKNDRIYHNDIVDYVNKIYDLLYKNIDLPTDWSY